MSGRKQVAEAVADRSRVIFTVSNDLSHDQRMHRICGTLAEHGWMVTLVGRRRRGSVPLGKFPFRIRRVNCLFERGKMFYAMLNIRLFWYLLFHKADVIGAVDLDTWLACRWASRLKGCKLAYDAHELFPEVPEVVRRPRIQKMWRRIERRAATKSHIRYTVSRSIAEHLRETYGKAFGVVRNVPEEIPSPKSQIPTKVEAASFKFHDSGSTVIVYQGALNEGRCLEPLLHAMMQVNGQLKVAGEGDLSSQLRTLAHELNLGDKVEFLGWVEPERLRGITAEASIGFNLLENTGLSYYYSLSNKFFDYIHAGVPQLCADFPEYRRINEQHEVAVLTDNIKPEAIAAQINQLLTDAERMHRLKGNCARAAKDFNWEKEEQSLIALYTA